MNLGVNRVNEERFDERDTVIKTKSKIREIEHLQELCRYLCVYYIGIKCAVLLRDIIAPYVLNRTKADVAKHLPKKTEQVLFCQLTKYQRDLYSSYISGREVNSVINNHASLFRAIINLRKICNHPDIFTVKQEEGEGEKKGKGNSMSIFAQNPDYGAVERWVFVCMRQRGMRKRGR